jgi:mono/diheme cytochrome c family protein
MNAAVPSSEPVDRAEPVAGSQPAPVWMFVALGLLAFGTLRFLDAGAGGFSPRVYQPYTSLDSLEALQPKSEGDVMFASGQRIYNAMCNQCHGPTGLGDLTRMIPPLAESEWVAASGPGRIIRLVLDGGQGPITVKGQVVNGGAMPPWRDVLKDEEIAAVLTYVRGNKNWGNSAPPVTPAQVKAIRDKVPARPSWLPEELLKVPEND